MPQPTDDQIARAKRMLDTGFDAEQLAHWIAAHEADRAEVRALAIDRDALRLCVEHLRAALYQERYISQELRTRIAGAVASGSWDDLETVGAAESGRPRSKGW